MGQASSRGRAARLAAERNDVEKLIEVASADPRAVLRSSPWKGRTPAHFAARAGSAAALAVIVDLAAHALGGPPTVFLNQPDSVDGDTALALAAKHGHADCVRELLEAGASPLPANAQGVTPLHFAAARGHAAIVRLLLVTPVRLPEGSRVRAADAQVPDVIDTERYIDTRTHAGLCALHLAVLCGSQPAVAELIQAGAQLDTPLLTVGFRAPALLPGCLAAGSTALHMAAATGRAPLVILLLHAQRTRHPGLELRRMRNARGMTPLNVALLCQHRNMAALLTAGASIPEPLVPLRRQQPAGQQLPALLRQQLLALVHRAALLSQLRQLGLGGGAAAEAPPLPGLSPGPVARLEGLLRSDSASASQVLAVVDELIDDSAGAAAGGAAPAAAAGGGGAGGGMGQRSLRRARRRQAQREALAQQLASAQAGVDWTLLERNRSLWAAEHMGGSALQRRLQRRRDQHRAAALAAAAAPPGEEEAAAAAALAAVAGSELGSGGEQEAELPPGGSSELMLAGALLAGAQQEPPLGEQLQRQAQQAQQAQHAADQQQMEADAAAGGGGGSSQGAPASPSSVGATAGADGPDAESLATASAAAAEAAAGGAACSAGGGTSCSAGGSQAEGALCPICLDAAADIALAPCGHRACLACCGRLASYCASSSFGLPLQSPLCPLCRAPIEAFRRAP